MTFKIRVVTRNSSREYGEFFTGNRAHHIQVTYLFSVARLICVQDQLLQGATIIISSEKIIVSHHTEELEMHPVRRSDASLIVCLALRRLHSHARVSNPPRVSDIASLSSVPPMHGDCLRFP